MGIKRILEIFDGTIIKGEVMLPELKIGKKDANVTFTFTFDYDQPKEREKGGRWPGKEYLWGVTHEGVKKLLIASEALYKYISDCRTGETVKVTLVEDGGRSGYCVERDGSAGPQPEERVSDEIPVPQQDVPGLNDDPMSVPPASEAEVRRHSSAQEQDDRQYKIMLQNAMNRACDIARVKGNFEPLTDAEWMGLLQNAQRFLGEYTR